MTKLSNVASWRFSDTQLSWERATYYKAINNYFVNQILENCRDNKELTDYVKNLMKSLDTKRPKPELIWMSLTKKINNDNTEYCINLLEELVLGNTYKKMVFRGLKNSGVDWIDDSINKIINSFDENHRKEMNLRCGTAHDEEIQKVILDALRLLEQLCPAAYNEAHDILKDCILLSGEGLKSSSVPTSFGALFLLPTEKWDIIDYLDLIVHETAHHSLVIKNSIMKLVNNPNELAKSPLRPDPRPINGIIHASFVLTRVCYVLIQYIKQNEPFNNKATKYVKEYLRKLDEGLKTLNITADWTPSGYELMNDLTNGYLELNTEMERLGVLQNES